MEIIKYHKSIDFENNLNKTFLSFICITKLFVPYPGQHNSLLLLKKGKKQSGNGKKQECVADSLICLNHRRKKSGKEFISNTQKNPNQQMF